MASFEIVEQEPRPAAVVEGAVPMDELPNFFAGAFHAVVAAATDQGLTIVGPPFAYYPAMPTDVVQVVAGFPVLGTIEPADEVRPFTLPGGRAAVAVHVGPYETLESTYDALLAWVTEQGLVPAVGMWEEYLSDPAAEPDPAVWRTRVVMPVTDA